ncbi:hypothetical protein E2C01_083216 [Portunus trituberculatus]|uniref:Uncharacterized protein n=1 Tax=Portunus trituberculatus TaxID=210409 RepID=A0A5B7J0K8_PORTR|nr:hypothetical protein [Portunus trituberculatus]
MWTFHGNLWANGDSFFWGYLLSHSPSARKPLPRVRKPNLHSDRGVDRIPTRVLGDPSEPKARMVPLYHGSLFSSKLWNSLYFYLTII